MPCGWPLRSSTWLLVLLVLGMVVSGVVGAFEKVVSRHVKSGSMAAMYAARECGADILLFGHTHQPLVDRSGDFWVMNPGCIGPSVRRTYGVITLEDGKVDCAAFRL